MGSLPDGRIGVGWATMSNARVDPAPVATLTVLEVERRVGAARRARRAGSVRERHDLLRSVFARSTEREQRFLVGVLGGELRQGALDGVMTSAIAAAADVPVASVRRASMMTGDLLIAASVALTGGSRGARRARRCSRAVRCCRCWPARRPTWRRRWRRPARRRWNGSSTAPACRPTAPSGGCASSPATSTRSPIGCRASSTPSPPFPAATSCSTVRRSASSTTARRNGSRTRWATSAPTRSSAGGAASGRSSST